ncbi:type II toxin-antitoxin system RelE/ParE family toxin [Falsiroseomonas sp.]|uniref:type II toxin-antitoxin system RelE/ParE family toxin n=1 Tax=Falsiroseomonas sp. TaxID=2870721 RepID=UPI003F70EC66
MRVLWTLGAQDDARALASEIAERNPVAARRLAEDLALSAERLSDFPQLGVAVGGTDRQLLIQGGRYRVTYRVLGNGLRIFGISRGTDPWPKREG